MLNFTQHQTTQVLVSWGRRPSATSNLKTLLEILAHARQIPLTRADNVQPPRRPCNRSPDQQSRAYVPCPQACSQTLASAPAGVVHLRKHNPWPAGSCHNILLKQESSNTLFSPGKCIKEPEEDLRCLGTVSNPSKHNSSSHLSRICHSISTSAATHTSNCSCELTASVLSSSHLTHASTSVADAPPFPLPPWSPRILQCLSGGGCGGGRRFESHGVRYHCTLSMHVRSHMQWEKLISGCWSMMVIVLVRSPSLCSVESLCSNQMNSICGLTTTQQYC